MKRPDTYFAWGADDRVWDLINPIVIPACIFWMLMIAIGSYYIANIKPYGQGNVR